MRMMKKRSNDRYRYAEAAVLAEERLQKKSSLTDSPSVVETKPVEATDLSIIQQHSPIVVKKTRGIRNKSLLVIALVLLPLLLTWGFVFFRVLSSSKPKVNEAPAPQVNSNNPMTQTN